MLWVEGGLVECPWWGGEGNGNDNVQAADERLRRAKRERMRVVGSMACGCWVGEEVGKRWAFITTAAMPL